MAHTNAIAEEAIAEVADELRQWRFLFPTGTTTLRPKSSFGQFPGRNAALKGTEPNLLLQHEEQSFGINLGWTNDASPSTVQKVTRWFFDRPGSSESAIVYGEILAMGNGGEPSFIRHASRTFGINLEWADAPVYEWRILGGTTGQPVRANDRVALFNTKAGTTQSPGNFLIYFDRTVGGDIGWPDSQTWGEQFKGKLGSLTWSAAKELVKKYFAS